jgi:peptidoglycan/xylan/chitin deacetylase (PgdA/CDA1 family)
MVRSLARLFPLVPLLALGAGSWVGLGEPKLSTMREGRLSFANPHVNVGDLAHLGVFGTHVAREGRPALPSEPVASGAGVPPVDAKLLPDPNPWPAINPQVSTTRAWLLSEGPRHDDRDGRRLVTFTFDDGPFPETTPVVLRVLEKHHVHATFFWIGRYLDGTSDRAMRTREVALQVRDAGHLIGTHTHDHERLIGISHGAVLGQIERGAASIERAIGVRPAVFRPPFGQLDAYGESVAREKGLTLVLWNVETQDLRHTDADAMARNIEEQIDFNGGGIVLLHDIRFSTADTLDKVLTWVDHHRYDPAHPWSVGYDVVDFAEFTRATAASPQPYPNRAALETARAAAWRSHHPESRPPVAACDEAPLAM